MKAMIFAAGLGTRLLGETADKPKALVEVGGKTLLEHAIEKVKTCPVSKIVVNVHHFAESVKSFVAGRDFGVPVIISDESQKLLDTGGGLKKAAPLLRESYPILLYNVDILSSIDLNAVIAEHRKTGTLATLVVRDRETTRYLKIDANNRLVGWVNKKTGETRISRPEEFGSAREVAFSGIHVISPEFLDLLPGEDRFSILDVYLELAKTKDIKVFWDESDMWMDVGKPEQLEEARNIFRNGD